MKRLVILGSTGSIGENALRVVKALPDRFQVVGLAAFRNGPRLLEQAAEFKVQDLAVGDPDAAGRCRRTAPTGLRVHEGTSGLSALAALPEADIVICSVVGLAGLEPVLAAIRAGKRIALATKEVLVAAGHVVQAACARSGSELIPVDSEHSAIFQCLLGHPGFGPCGSSAGSAVRRLLLTASGGPFGLKPEVDFNRVTVAEALQHPRWNMGRKISVDSATLMNKGLEVLEARWLFDMPVDRIDVVIHPESIVHSMVEFTDGSVLAQMSLPDMRYAIQFALTYPDRVDGNLPTMDLVKLGPLTFRSPDRGRFPCLELAYRAARAGGTLPAVLNGANEVAVAAFLEGRISFPGIWQTVESVMERHPVTPDPDLEAVVEADRWSRAMAGEISG